MAVNKKKIKIIEVERYGDKLIVPESMNYKDAIETLQKQRDYEERVTGIQEEIKGYFVLDVAHAFYEVLKEKFGIVHQKEINSFWGTRPPQMIQVAVSTEETVQVPWGRIELRVLEDGYLETRIGGSRDEAYFTMYAEVKRKYSEIIKQIAQATRKYLQEHSIYQGRALEVTFRDEDGERMPFPDVKFMELGHIDEDDVILNQNVYEQVHTNLLTPLKYSDVCRANNIPMKRGVLLAGPYGTGKSLTAQLTAKIATQNKFTFIYVRKPNELFEAYKMTEFYKPSVIFCEDIDILLKGERDENMNKISNILDGVETKNYSTITVLTTNYLENINPVFLRPGRLDAVIYMELPDSLSVQKLIRKYAGDLISKDEDLSEVGENLADNAPAIIREVVEKGKLYQIFLDGGKKQKSKLTAAALLSSAKQMTGQIETLKKASAKKENKRIVQIATVESVKIEQGKEEIISSN